MQECNICFNNFDSLVSVHNFDCIHVYCYECHENLKKCNHNNCPTCRANRLCYHENYNDEKKESDYDIINIHNIFSSVEIKIGTHVIDKQYSEWLNIWHELTDNQSQQDIKNTSKIESKQIKSNYKHPAKELTWLRKQNRDNNKKNKNFKK